MPAFFRGGTLPGGRRTWRCAAVRLALMLALPTACGNSFTSAANDKDEPRGGEGGVDTGSGGSPRGGSSGKSSSDAGGDTDGGEGPSSSGGGSGGSDSPGGSGGADASGGAGLTAGSGSAQGGGSAGQETGGDSGMGGSGASAGAGGQACAPTVIGSRLPALFTWESFTDSVFTGSTQACTYCNASPCGECSVTWGTAVQSGEDVLVPITTATCSVAARYGTCGVPSGQGACTLSATVMNAVATLRLARTSTGVQVTDAALAASWDGAGCADDFSDERLSTSINTSLRSALVGVSAACQ